MQISLLFEALPLLPIFNFGLVAGTFLSLLLMQLTNQYEELNGVSPLLQWLHRTGLAAAALCFLWTFLYGRNMSWEPWPPMAALIVVIDFKLALRSIMLHQAIRRIKAIGAARYKRIHTRLPAISQR